MSIRAIGLILLWLGTLLLVAVLQHRLRRGAWSEDAFEAPPPVPHWQIAAAASGMVLAALGAALIVWDLW